MENMFNLIVISFHELRKMQEGTQIQLSLQPSVHFSIISPCWTELIWSTVS